MLAGDKVAEVRGGIKKLIAVTLHWVLKRNFDQRLSEDRAGCQPKIGTEILPAGLDNSMADTCPFSIPTRGEIRDQDT
jgi:hypothetical protein